MLAVLRRSEVQLHKAINASPQSVNDPNNVGQTALHFSLEWSIGIRVLLDAKAELNRADNLGYTPIMRACQLSLLDAVQLLGNAGSALHVGCRAALDVAMDNEFSCRTSNCGTEETKIAEKIVDYIIELEADRRRRLSELALTSLPRNAMKDLESFGDGLLDEHAMSVIWMLKRHNIIVPDALIPCWMPTTGYHSRYLTVRIANKLWMTGFKNIGGLFWDGKSWWQSSIQYELDLNDTLELVAWFQSKEEDLHGIAAYEGFGRDRSTTSNLHIIAYRLGTNLRKMEEQSIREQELHLDFFAASAEDVCAITQRFTYETYNLSDVAKRMLTNILMDSEKDSCLCACSTGGCSTVVLTLKPHTREDIYSPGPLKPFWYLCMTTAFIEFVELLEPKFSDLSSDIVRFLTFSVLDLSHTCCRCERYYIGIIKFDDEDDIQRIHDEEKEMIEKFEGLLVEFENKKSELGISTSEFLLGYWRERMREVLNEPGVFNKEEVEALGVRVYETDNVKEDETDNVKEFEADSENQNEAHAEEDIEVETRNEDDTKSSGSDDNDSVYVDAE
jgi:hypothetical protein